MTIPVLKISVARKPVLKGKMGVRFPANIRTEKFLSVDRANGAYTFDIDYTLLSPGPISDPTTAYVAVEDKSSGLYKEVSLASLLASSLDADLQAIAALTGTGILSRTADNTWALRSVTAGFGLTVTNGDGVSGNISIAITEPELVALAGLTSAANKLPYFTGSGTAALADFSAFGRSLVDDADATAAQETLGLTIGTNVQAYNARLADIAGVSFAQGDILYFNGTNLAKLPAGTSGNYLKTQGTGANPIWDSLGGGGDMLGANNLSDVASPITSLTNLGIPTVTIENFGGGVGVSDNTTALLAAVASVTGPVRVLFPNNGEYKFTQNDAITFTKGGVYLEGSGRNTALKYDPTANGIFLKWLAPVGIVPVFGGGVKNLSIISHDYTYTKTAVWSGAVSMFQVDNVAIGYDPRQTHGDQAWSGGTGSVCFYPHGWDFGRVHNVWFSGDKPVQIGMNPYWSYAQDHWHWSDCYFQGTTNVGDFPNVSIDPGVAFSNTTFDFQSWVNGSNGFQNINSGGVNAVYAINTAGSGYAVGDTITLGGGTVTTAPVAIVLAVGVGGAITAAAIKSPGTGVTAYPASNLWTQSSTSGSGTGAKLNAYYVYSFNLKFADMRIEQGDPSVGASCWNFYIQEGGINGAGTLDGVTFENVHLDGNRNGIFLQNTSGVAIRGCKHIGNNSYSVTTLNATAANNNLDVKLDSNIWSQNTSFPLNASLTGMSVLSSIANPSTTNATVLQNARYSKTALAQTFAGVNDGSNAPAGSVGEYVTSTLSSGSAGSLSSGITSNITSISLTAGDWDVDCSGHLLPANTTSVTNATVSMSTTSGTVDITPGKTNNLFQNATVYDGTLSVTLAIPPYRFSLTTTTTVYLVMRGTFTVSTAKGFGIIQARRVR